MTAQLHFAIDALTLQLLLERAESLVDVVIANDDLQKFSNLTATTQSPRRAGLRLSESTKNVPNPFRTGSNGGAHRQMRGIWQPVMRAATARVRFGMTRGGLRIKGGA